MSLCQPVIWSMAAMLRDSIVIAAVVRTRPRAIPLAMITMRKSTHGFPFVSHIWVAYGAPLSGPSGPWSSAIKADLDVIINLTLDPAHKLQIFALLLRGLCSRNTQCFRQLEKVNFKLLFFIYATECWASRISWLESFGLDFSWTTALHCKITTNLKPWLFLLKNRIYT